MRSVFLPEEVVGHHVLSAVWIAVRLDHTTVTGGLLHIKFYLHIKIWLLFPSLAVSLQARLLLAYCFIRSTAVPRRLFS